MTDSGPTLMAQRRAATRVFAARRAGGFTLLEVLVALLLMALALGALVRLTSLEARATAHLRDATLSQWLAANLIAETRLREAFPEVGDREGETQYGARRWRWRLQVSSTDEPTIRRIDVFVRPSGDDSDTVSASLTGFAEQR